MILAEEQAAFEEDDETRMFAAALVLRLRWIGITDHARAEGRSRRCRARFSCREEFRRQAYEDRALPIACGQTISRAVGGRR